MNMQSLKFTLRGFFRDIVRGIPARWIIYPKIRRNEYSSQALREYWSSIGVNEPPKSDGLSIITDDSNCVTKSDVRQHPEWFIRSPTLSTLPRNKIQTSGTSGQPLTLTQDYRSVLREEAFVYRQLRWAGYRSGDRKVWLRGDVIRAGAGGDAPVKCRDWWTNTLMLSSYHISTATAKSYVDSIASFDPVLIQAYPSSIYALACWLLANNQKYAGGALKGIVTSSETLNEEMRSKVERAFDCRVFDWYGQAERVVAIGTCEYGSRHVITDYGNTELIQDSDDKFELVGTGYNNRAMTIARYRTGDYVELGNSGCRCNRVFPTVKSVIGRLDEVIELNDGRLIGRLDHVFKGMNNVSQGQVAYVGNDRFVLRVVPGPGWDQSDAERLSSNLRERVENVEVAVELVEAIPRSANGKTRFVIREDRQ
jgi:phenylacetate-CoA ligase